MTTKERIGAAFGALHLSALRQARVISRAVMAGKDRSLPELAEQRTLNAPGAAGPLEARYYRPAGVSAEAPLMLFFHGGGFLISDLDTHEALCIRLAAAGQMRVLSARYRMAPEHPFPAQLDDAIAVAEWVLGGAGGLLGPRQAFAVGGDSAGAFLAASAAAHVGRREPSLIRAQLLLYPFLHLGAEAWAEDLHKESRAVGWAVVRYINSQLAEVGAELPSLSDPAQFAPAPVLIVSGGLLDPCRIDARRLAETLERAGRAVIWRDYPGQVHGFANLTHWSRAARRAVAEIGEMFGAMAAAQAP